jgi:hypothetical protein
MIYTSFWIYFCIKNQFPGLFLYFYYTQDHISNSIEYRGPCASVPKTQNSIRKDGGLIKPKHRVSFERSARRRGMVKSRPPDQLRTVQIKSKLHRTGEERWPPDRGSMVVILKSHRQTLPAHPLIYGHGLLKRKVICVLIWTVRVDPMVCTLLQPPVCLTRWRGRLPHSRHYQSTSSVLQVLP